jgi:hypothetical protein
VKNAHFCAKKLPSGLLYAFAGRAVAYRQKKTQPKLSFLIFNQAAILKNCRLIWQRGLALAK